MFENFATRSLEVKDHRRPLTVDKKRALLFRSHFCVKVGRFIRENMLFLEHLVTFGGGPISTPQSIVLLLHLETLCHLVSGELQGFLDVSKAVVPWGG